MSAAARRRMRFWQARPPEIESVTTQLQAASPAACVLCSRLRIPGRIREDHARLPSRATAWFKKSWVISAGWLPVLFDRGRD